MSKFSTIDPKYKVFRCFAVYNCNTQQVIVKIQRQCGKLFEETIMRVQDYVKQNLQDSQRYQLLISTGDRSEWHGILEEKSNCYFLMMTFPGSQQSEVRSSLLDLQYTIMGINNYTKYSDDSFPKQKKDELMVRIDDLEKKYVEKYGGEGQPNQNEVQNQGSQVSNQFLQTNQLKPNTSTSKIKEPYRKNGVYRCFMVFNVANHETLFLQKRGTGKSFTETEESLKKKLKTQINETTKFDFFMQGNIRSDWHGILDEQKSCYFLMMTFPSSSQKNVREALSELKKIITTYPNYDRASKHDLERRFQIEIQKTIDNLEIKYHNIVGNNEGVPSEEESIIRGDYIESNKLPNKHQQQPNQNNQQQQSSKISLSPPMSKIEEDLNPPDNPFEGDSKKLVDTAILDIQKEVKKLEGFKPNAQDAIKFLFAGVGFSFIIFTVFLVDLYS